jgi:RNA polymerase sigma-70 factor (ECF subfamily)
VSAGRRADEPPTDAERFEAFVREYQDMVFATAVRLLGNATEAEDVAQTAFLRAFERFAAVGTSPTAAGWLKTVATNLCLNHLSRYRARWQTFGDLDRGESAGGGAEVIADAGHASPLDAVEQADRAERLERALQALPDHQRVPLVLFHFQDMSYQEIASKLGVSLAKVKTDIHRARERLRSELSDLYESR